MYVFSDEKEHRDILIANYSQDEGSTSLRNLSSKVRVNGSKNSVYVDVQSEASTAISSCVITPLV